MAPVTRSKAPKADGAHVPATGNATGAPKRKPQPKKSRKKNAPAVAAPARAASPRVQRKSGPKKKFKGKKTPPKSSLHPSSSSQSASSSKASATGGGKKKATRATLFPTTSLEDDADDEGAEEDFPELREAYGILPFLDPPSPGSRPGTPRPRAGQGRWQGTRLFDDEEIEQFAQHVGSAPSFSSRERPETHVEGFEAWLPKGLPPLAESNEYPAAAHPDQSGPIEIRWPSFLLRETAWNPADRVVATHDRRHGESSWYRRMVSHSATEGSEQPSSSPRARMSDRRTSGAALDIWGQAVRQRPESVVSVQNAKVFKRPTVASVRRERGLLHDELSEWAERLRRARDEFDGVTEEIEGRMRVLKAVNKMQAPLRRAPLGGRWPKGD